MDFDLTTFLLGLIAVVLVVGLILLGVVAYYIWRKRVPIKGALALLAAVAYFMSPVDAVPEFPFGPIGLVDDAGVLAAAFMYAQHLIRARREGLPLTTGLPRRRPAARKTPTGRR